MAHASLDSEAIVKDREQSSIADQFLRRHEHTGQARDAVGVRVASSDEPPGALDERGGVASSPYFGAGDHWPSHSLRESSVGELPDEVTVLVLVHEVTFGERVIKPDSPRPQRSVSANPKGPGAGVFSVAVGRWGRWSKLNTPRKAA